MKAHINKILKKIKADVTKNGFDDQMLDRAVALMQTLTIETEEDQRLVMLGQLQLMDILLPYIPEAATESMQALRRQVEKGFDRMYGRQDSPYAVTVRITAALAQGLNQGGSLDQLVADASAELDTLQFDDSPEDAVVAMDGRIRLVAMQFAYQWFQKATHDEAGENPVITIISNLAEALQRNGFDKSLVLEASNAIQEAIDDQQSIAAGLLHVWGMGLLLKPDAAPALEPIRDRLIELTAQLSGVESTAEASSPEPELEPARYDSILSELEAALERDGYSEYAFQQAAAAIKALPTESEEEAANMRAALLRIIDITVPYAPGEGAQSLAVARQAIEKMGEPDAFDDLTNEEIHAQAEAILSELKQNLEAGESPAPAVTRAITKFQVLSARLGQADEETAEFVMGEMQKIFSVLQPYIPEESGYVFNEAAAFIDSAVDGVNVNRDDPISMAVFETQTVEQMGRFTQAIDMQGIPGETAAIPHIRQFRELFLGFMDRMKPMFQMLGRGEGDEAELDRLHKRLDQPLDALRFAYSEEQVICHQREGLRGTMLEFSQFERRRQLMIVHPVFPTNPVTVDPNDVFFSGTDTVAELVKKACHVIDMKLAPKPSLQNKTYARWQQLRSSGIAIFDYSAYDPKNADPLGPIKRSRKGEAKILGAAGPVAMVAYETGWADVLGTPMVIIARKGQTIPFDIDVEPVFLEDDGGDVERIIAAIQTAIYGVQHGVVGDCLADTLAQASKLYSNYQDPQVRKLLAALTDVDDATRVRLALTAVTDRIEAENPMLILPSFPGSYPLEGQRELFHITAFRDWSKDLQEEARMACERAGVIYRIGYERMTPDIIRIIWTDICRASFVIADITNLNPNAVLELAMAQAVGCPTLILTRNSQSHIYLPAIEKVRSHYYDPDNERGKLSSLLDDFLSGKE